MKKCLKHGMKVALCALIAAQVGSVLTFASSLKVNDVVHQFASPVNENGNLVEKGSVLADALKLESVWNASEKALTLSNKAISARFVDGQTSFTVNDEIKYLPVAAKAEGDTLILPLRTVCETFGWKVVWDSAEQAVNISMRDISENVGSLLLASPAQSKKMPYKEALDAAIDKNSSIKNLLDNLEYSRQKRREMIEVYDASRADIETAIRFQASEEMTAWMRGLTQLESGMTTMNLTQEIIKTTSEMMLRSYISQIRAMEMDITQVKDSVALAQTNWLNISKKQSVGMASDSDLKKAKQDLDKMKVALSSLETGLKNQRLALNQLIGAKPDDIIDVLFVPKITELHVNLDSYAVAMVAEDPKIKILEEDLRVAEYNLLTFDDRYYSDSDKRNLENKVDEAKRALNDARDSMEKSIRSAYYNLISLKENQVSLNLDLQKAKDTYNNALISYEAGVITKFDTEQAKSAILQTEIKIANNLYNYDNLYFSFSHPFLLSSS